MGDSIYTFFSANEQASIKQAVVDAEKQTSGEIRVHIENHCRGDVLDRATHVFSKLEMHKTELRNGVLFYLAVKDHKFAILGDAGINQKVSDNFWDQIKEDMASRFKERKFAEGLEHGIQAAGEQLKSHFPYQQDTDINELPDDISFGKD